MTRLAQFFHTDFEAMTGVDWFGFTLTVVIFLLMVGIYTYVFHPKKGKNLNIHGDIPFEEERFGEEEKNDGRKAQS